MTVRIEIGPGYSIEPVTAAGDDPERIVGYIERHPRPDTGEECSGFLWTDATSRGYEVGKPLWTVVMEEPLTLSPSVLCRTCGTHGFIQAGRWVPA